MATTHVSVDVTCRDRSLAGIAQVGYHDRTTPTSQSGRVIDGLGNASSLLGDRVQPMRNSHVGAVVAAAGEPPAESARPHNRFGRPTRMTGWGWPDALGARLQPGSASGSPSISRRCPRAELSGVDGDKDEACVTFADSSS